MIPAPIRLDLRDVLDLGLAGLRARPLRALLSALGIAIGIAAVITVVGISSSGRHELDQQLAELGTNLLTVSPGTTLFGDDSVLPDTALPMIDQIPAVTGSSATGLTGASVYRNEYIPTGQTGSIAVLATGTDLLETVAATIESGAFLDAATAEYPAVVLGATAAHHLGVGAAGAEQQVWLGDQWFTVAGVLNPAPLAPELDNAALVGWPVAQNLLHFDGHATTIYTRAEDDAVTDVAQILAATADPEHPNQVDVSRPSDALAAQQAADTALNGLLVGLGGVALLVGGVGVANTMIISVIERRAEIGLRRALGATRRHIRVQFLTESLLLAALGGSAGAVLGAAITTGYAVVQDWTAVVPSWAVAGGLGATMLVGVTAGLYPAVRASRTAPTGALAT